MSVINFPNHKERSERIRAKFTEDFKKRHKAHVDCGEMSSDIWAWEEMLQESGWTVSMYSRSIRRFCTFVDYDKKVLANNNPKAYHAQQALKAAIDKMFEGAKGRWLFVWEEVQDEAHKQVRDQPEWEGSELFGTVWYTMELFAREMVDGEVVPPMEEEYDA